MPLPPAMRTLPLASNVEVWEWRGPSRSPVGTKLELDPATVPAMSTSAKSGPKRLAATHARNTPPTSPLLRKRDRGRSLYYVCPPVNSGARPTRQPQISMNLAGRLRDNGRKMWLPSCTTENAGATAAKDASVAPPPAPRCATSAPHRGTATATRPTTSRAGRSVSADLLWPDRRATRPCATSTRRRTIFVAWSLRSPTSASRS